MSKVHITQIAYMGEEAPTEYLDSCGRVWYDGGHAEQYTDVGSQAIKSRWVTEWKQVDLPEEPEL